MGKSKKDKMKGAEKTAMKTEKKAALKMKKELRAKGEDDIEQVIAEIQEYDRQRLEVIEEVVPPPTPRSSFSLTVNHDKDELILYGGEYFNGKKTFVYGDLYFYNINKDVWTLVKIPNCPPPRCSHQTVCLQQGGGLLWMFGGEFSSPSQLQFHHYRDLWMLHLPTRKWEKITSPAGPSARSGHRMVVSKRQLIVFGGFNDNSRECRYFNDVYAFNLDTYIWTRLECNGKAPTPRSGCQMMALLDGRIVIYGGYSKETVKRDVERGVVHSDMFLLQPEKGDEAGIRWRWSSVKQTGMRPSPRCGFSLVSVPSGSTNRALLFGGVFDTEEDEESLKGTFFDQLYQLDLDKYKWTVVKLTGLVVANRKLKSKTNEMETDDIPLLDDEPSVATASTSQVVKTYDDGVFSVTIGEQNSSCKTPSIEILKTDEPNDDSCVAAMSSRIDLNTPHKRMNCGLAIKHGVLYLYGGVYEDGDRNVTLSDFYKLDTRKFDRWHTILKCNIQQQEWIDSSSDSSTDGEDNEDDQVNDI